MNFSDGSSGKTQRPRKEYRLAALMMAGGVTDHGEGQITREYVKRRPQIKRLKLRGVQNIAGTSIGSAKGIRCLEFRTHCQLCW